MTRFSRWAAGTLACLLALATVLLGAAPASAHAALVDSDPADGASLPEAPGEVSFTFSEDIQQPAYVVVTAAGERVEQGKVRVDGTRVSVDVAADAPAGRWTMAYRVVSVDGHPVTGTVAFEVERARATPSESASPSETAPSASPSQEASSTRAAAGTAADDDTGWWPLHAEHVALGAGLLVLAAGVLVWARRRAG